MHAFVIGAERDWDAAPERIEAFFAAYRQLGYLRPTANQSVGVQTGRDACARGALAGVWALLHHALRHSSADGAVFGRAVRAAFSRYGCRGTSGWRALVGFASGWWARGGCAIYWRVRWFRGECLSRLQPSWRHVLPQHDVRLVPSGGRGQAAEDVAAISRATEGKLLRRPAPPRPSTNGPAARPSVRLSKAASYRQR